MKTLLKIMFAIGAIFLILAGLRYLDEQRTDYIKIYNDDLDEDMFA